MRTLLLLGFLSALSLTLTVGCHHGHGNFHCGSAALENVIG